MCCKAKSGGLTLDDEVGRALYAACTWSNEECNRVLYKAAKIVRHELFQNEEIFDGDVSLERQSASVPSVLTELIAMILEGGASNRNLSAKLEEVSTYISQVIRYNSVKRTRADSVETFRHSIENEPPLPVLIGLTVHAKSRRKSLVDSLAKKGLSINYDRVLELSRIISNQVCSDYQEKGFVSPKNLKDNIFTTAAIDNLDHNLTSVTAQKSFHGTTVSIFQHPSIPILPVLFRLETKNADRCSMLSLPESFTDIKPTPEIRAEPTQRSLTNCNFDGKSVIGEMETWINVLRSDPVEGTKIHFSGFYSDQSAIPIQSGSHLLPLISEPVTAPATVRHATHIAKDIIRHTNPGQVSVITGDQPVYAIGKQLQWKFPNEFGDVLWMLGPLHIEQVYLKVIGDWLEKSGWTEIYDYGKINSNGVPDAFLTCSGAAGIKRSRYAHQLTLAALTTLAHEAFNSQSEISDFEEWKCQLESKSTTAKYWFTVIDLEKILFAFVRSLRESNF